jgi:hypothetical protein
MAIAAAASAAIGAAGSIGSAVIGSNAANKAANTQLQMYNQTRQDLQPYMNTGTSALSQLSSLFGLGAGGSGVPNTAGLTQALTNFPGYQFGLQQGQTALDQSAASQGMVLSGGQLQASQQFGQNYAMQNAWQPYLSQLNSLSSLGENAGAQVGNQGTQAAANAGTAQLAAGSAAAGGALGVSNTLNSQLPSIISQLNGAGGGAGGGALNTNANPFASLGS